MYRQYVYTLRQMNLRKKMAQNSKHLFFKKPLNNLHFQNVWPTGNEFPANNLLSSFAPKHWSVKFSTIAYTLARKHFKIFVGTTSAITFRLKTGAQIRKNLQSAEVITEGLKEEWENSEARAGLRKADKIVNEKQGGYFRSGDDVQGGWQKGEAMKWQEETEMQRNEPSKWMSGWDAIGIPVSKHQTLVCYSAPTN